MCLITRKCSFKADNKACFIINFEGAQNSLNNCNFYKGTATQCKHKWQNKCEEASKFYSCCCVECGDDLIFLF